MDSPQDARLRTNGIPLYWVDSNIPRPPEEFSEHSSFVEMCLELPQPNPERKGNLTSCLKHRS
jgi:hypothetical protein